MKIVVTGGAGFIGRHLVLRSLAQHDTHTLDRVYGSDLVFGSGLEHLRDADAVIHLSACADISKNWAPAHNRAAVLNDGLVATVRLLEMMPNARLVMASTCAVYGSRPGAVETDAVPETMTSPYAAGKLAAEAFIAAYAHKRKFPWHVFRLSAVYGSGYHHGHVADFVASAQREGFVRCRDDGTQKMPGVHVADVVDAFETALFGKIPSGIYNLSSAERWSCRDTIELMGCNAVYGPSRSERVGDLPGMWPETGKLSPYFVANRPLRDGVADALESLGWPVKRAA